MSDTKIKERLTAAIDIVLQEGISKEPIASRFSRRKNRSAHQ